MPEFLRQRDSKSLIVVQYQKSIEQSYGNGAFCTLDSCDYNHRKTGGEQVLVTGFFNRKKGIFPS
jgi:hypothetical protein